MATTKGRYYPTHPVDKVVDPERLNEHQRQAFDGIFDLQMALSQMTGGATAFAILNGTALGSIVVAFPGFGYTKPPKITVAGATAVGTINNGRLVSISFTGGAGPYAAPPAVTITP